MAFEEVNTAGFKTYLTRYGVSKLLNPNAKFDVKYFSLSDEGINYTQTVDSSVLVTSVNGDDYCFVSQDLDPGHLLLFWCEFRDDFYIHFYFACL